MEKEDHQKITKAFEQEWDKAFSEWNAKNVEITPDLVRTRLDSIKSTIDKQFSGWFSKPIFSADRGMSAPMSYSKWGKPTGRQVFIKAQLSKSGKALSGKRLLGKALVVWVVISAYDEARADGMSEEQALGEAAAEAINFSPTMSVREMVREYESNNNWEYILNQSYNAYTNGKTLINGFTTPDDPRMTRAHWYREFRTDLGIRGESHCENEPD